jgi:hypothetical protein
MSLLMSTLMSAWVTWLNLGFVSDYVSRWLHALAAAWPCAFAIVVLAAPEVQNLARRLAGVPMQAPAAAPQAPVRGGRTHG